MRIKLLPVFLLLFSLHSLLAQVKTVAYKTGSAALNDQLLAFWDFNEGKGSLLTDYSGNNYHGRIIGLPLSGWILGHHGNRSAGADRAIDLSYANRAVTFPTLQTAASQATISVWLLPSLIDNTSAEQIILSSGNPSGPVLKMQDNGTISFTISGQPEGSLLSTQKLIANRWQHVTITVNDAAHRIMLYIDGKQAGLKSLTASCKVNLDSTFTVGRHQSISTPTFDGVVDDVLLFSRALPAEEIAGITNGELPDRKSIELNKTEQTWKTTAPQRTAGVPVRTVRQLDQTDFPSNPLEKEGFVLTAHDEFDGPQLNDSMWIPYYLRQRVSDEAGKADIAFRDGSIILKISKDKKYYNDKGMRVSSLQTLENPDLHKPGKRKDIPTQKKFTQQYGYFEIRAKTQVGSGHCSSFWLLGEGGQQKNPGMTGEVDVIEQPGNLGPNSVAYNLYDWSDTTIGTRITNMGWQNRLRFNKDLTKTFNLYAVEWTPTELKFFFNNQLINTIPNSIHYPMGIFLSLYEGNDWFGNVDPAQAFPKEFVIDYFRAYQKK